jgi:hypothetical protein
MAQAFCGSDARREVLDAALRDSLPAARNEAWKHLAAPAGDAVRSPRHRRPRRWTPRCWTTSRRRAWCSSTAAWCC